MAAVATPGAAMVEMDVVAPDVVEDARIASAAEVETTTAWAVAAAAQVCWSPRCVTWSALGRCVNGRAWRLDCLHEMHRLPLLLRQNISRLLLLRWA
mmetsp:Transcript_61550/g.169199  ORF Transcript_61550/g.169199 Transcript_61550/m.169199 type:complete len:97 (-) Transcript_61550:410-700(-)